MRILFTTEQYPPETGGVGAVTHGFAHGLAKRGHSISVVSTKHPTVPWTSEPAGSGGAAVRVRGARGASARFVKMLPIGWAIQRAIRSERPQIVFASDYRPTGLVAVQLARATRVPVVIFVHGTQLFTEWRTALRRALMRDAFRRAALLAANTRNTAGLIAERMPDLETRVETVHPGVEVSRFRIEPEPEGDPTLLCAARLIETKGIDLLLDAVARLRSAAFPNLRLLVAGDGPARESLRSRARDLGLDRDAVVWLGDVPSGDMPSLMSRCHVFVLPTRFESFGIVYIEAGASGRAVVGSRIRGVPEAVIEGKTGLLVNPENASEIAEAVGRLLSDPALRRTMGEEGRRRAESLDWSVQTRKMESLLESLVAAEQ